MSERGLPAAWRPIGDYVQPPEPLPYTPIVLLGWWHHPAGGFPAGIWHFALGYMGVDGLWCDVSDHKPLVTRPPTHFALMVREIPFANDAYNTKQPGDNIMGNTISNATGPQISLGDLVRDRVTKFEGIVTCRLEYLYGFTNVEITEQGVSNDGNPIVLYVDVRLVELITKGAVFLDTKNG